MHIIEYIPVEQHSPFCRAALRFVVRSLHVWHLFCWFLLLLVVNKRQQTLRRLLTPSKTLQKKIPRDSFLILAPGVQGQSPRYRRSLCFSWTHHPDGTQRFFRSSYSSVGFSQSSSVGAGWVMWECVCFSAAGFCSRGRSILPVQAHRTNSVSVSASCLLRGFFALRYADGGCPMFNHSLLIIWKTRKHWLVSFIFTCGNCFAIFQHRILDET